MPYLNFRFQLLLFIVAGCFSSYRPQVIECLARGILALACDKIEARFRLSDTVVVKCFDHKLMEAIRDVAVDLPIKFLSVTRVLEIDFHADSNQVCYQLTY